MIEFETWADGFVGEVVATRMFFLMVRWTLGRLIRILSALGISTTIVWVRRYPGTESANNYAHACLRLQSLLRSRNPLARQLYLLDWVSEDRLQILRLAPPRVT